MYGGGLFNILSIFLIIIHSTCYCDNLGTTSKFSAIVAYSSGNKCFEEFIQVLELKSENAAGMFKSWSKFEESEVLGSFADFGDYQLCRSLKINEIHTQYCLVQYLRSQETSASFQYPNGSFYNYEWRNIGGRYGGAVCIPESCSSDDIRAIMSAFFDGSDLIQAKDYDQSRSCKRRSDRFELTWMGVVFITLTVLNLSITTTAEFSSQKSYETFTSKLLACFEIKKNFARLFTLKHEENSIKCLNGIKAISAFMIVAIHSASCRFQFPFESGSLRKSWNDGVFVKLVSTLCIFVEPFFIISGALITISLMRQLEKGKIRYIKLVFQRYMRLAPAVFVVSMVNDIGMEGIYHSAPYSFRSGYKDFCQNYWWASMLFIQNYVNPEGLCIPQTWYLSVDWQMFMISPILILLVRKSDRNFVATGVFLTLCSFLIDRYSTIVVNGFTPDHSSILRVLTGDYFYFFYYQTHIRGFTYICGMILGYFLYTSKPPVTSDSTLNKRLRSTALVLAIIYILIYPIPGEYLSALGPKSIETLVFAIGTPIWVLCVIIIIYSCCQGFGGVVNDFLSWKYWLPISRMSYSIYMVGSSVQYAINAMRLTPIDADNILYFIIEYFVDLAAIIPAAMLLYLLVEVPFTKIGKVISDKYLKF